MSDWDPEAVAEQMRQLGRDWAERWPQLITCHVERPARLRGYIATLSTRRDVEDRPFLYLIDEGQWVTADNGHGYRDEIGDGTGRSRSTTWSPPWSSTAATCADCSAWSSPTA